MNDIARLLRIALVAGILLGGLPFMARGQSPGVLRDVWTGISGVTVADLTNSVNYPDYSDIEEVLPNFEAPTDVMDNYGQRLMALVTAPQTGNYVFWIASDDGSTLFLSTNDQPGNKREIASVPGWTASREWTKYPEQQSASISLVAGQSYYIEALMKEGGGGDNLAVRWQLPNATFEEPIPGSRLQVYGLGPPQITQQPSDLTVTEGGTATFSVQLARSFGATYQWFRSGTNIPGATSSVYWFAPVKLGDNNAQFRCAITNSQGSTNTRNALLTVQADTTPPTISSVVNLGDPALITVLYSEPVEAASATNRLNYGINNGISVNSVSFAGDTQTVVLRTTPMSPGITYTLTVNNVRDRATTPNTIVSPTQRTFSLDYTPLDVNYVKGTSEPLGPSNRRSGLAISEIMYHPAARADGKNLEYLEVFNSNDWPEDLSGYRLTSAVDYTFPSNVVLAARSFLVVAAVPVDIQSVYAITNVFGPFTNNLPNGAAMIRLRNRSGGVLVESKYASDPPYPPAADGTGHSLVLARPSYGEGNPLAWATSEMIGGSPGRAEPTPANPYRTVLINELLTHTDPPELDYVELFNYSAQSVNLSGCFLSDDPNTLKFRIPDGTTIPARGFLVYDETQLGFRLAAEGQTVFLVNSNQNRAIDAIRFGPQTNGVSIGRFPDGAPDFRELSAKTPGTANSRPLLRDMVINEIMYDPISGDSDDEYVELYNRGSTPIDLGNHRNLGPYRLRGGISFSFPTNTIIPANGYVVVAKNAQRLLTNYLNLTTNNTFGNFSGSLANGGDRVTLTIPEDLIRTNNSIVVTNIAHIGIDEVTYDTGGRWPQWAHGGGSSLELIDPRSDHHQASSWAASDETAKAAPWTTVSVTGVLDNGNGAMDELQLFLQGAGECLVDDVEVFAQGGPNLVANSNFESGLSGWVAQGNHDQSSLENTGYNSSRSLHVRATGRGDSGANRLRVPLTAQLSAGATATLRAKVRWLKGYPGVLLRLHGNFLEAIGDLAVPTNLGTPGAPNTQAAANGGPSSFNVTHSPVLPSAGQAVTVTAQVCDPDGLSSVLLKYRVDPSTNFTAVSMQHRGAGFYAGTIPAQAAGTTVAFYIQAADAAAAGATTRFPADAPGRECLVRFGETQPAGNLGTYRIWLSQANLDYWARRLPLDNGDVDATFVYGNSRVVYNAGALYSGSPFISPGYNSPVGNLCGYVLHFPPDALMLNVTDFLLDWPIRDGTFVLEPIANWMADQLGLPYDHRRFVNLFVNGVQRGSIYYDSQQPGSDVVEEWFSDDTGGDLFKINDWFEFNDSAGMEFNVDATLQNFTTTGGIKKLARYRWNWLRRATDTPNDYTNLFRLVDALNAPTPEPWASQVDDLVSIEQWMRIFAVEHIVGNWDAYGYNRGKNMFTYKPQNGKWHMIMWDIDFLLGSGGDGPTSSMFAYIGGDSALVNLYNQPASLRAYYRAWQDAVDGPLLAAKVNPAIDAMYAGLLANGIPASDPSGGKTFINDRRNYLIQQLATVASGFALTSNGGSNFSTNRNYITLTGTAPVTVKTIEINGVEYPVTWTGVTTWTLNYALGPGSNALTIQGYDLRGNPIAGASDTITVTYTGPTELPQDKLVINEIMYNSAVPDGGFIEIYNRSTTVAFDLSNYRLNGADFTFDEGTIVQPGAYLVIAKDRAAFAAIYGSSIPVAGVYHGTLDNGGETLQIIQPGVTPDQDVVIDEVTYDNDPPWPGQADGFGPSLQLIDAAEDNNRVANWAVVTTNSPPPTPQWQYVTATGSAGDSRLYVYLQSAGEVYIDDLMVVAGSTPEVGPNFVVNGDFEAALSTGWTTTPNTANSTTSTAVKHSGNRSLHLVCNGPGSTTTDCLLQSVSGLTGGGQYTLSFWYLPNTSGVTLTVRFSGSWIRADRNILWQPGSTGSMYTPGAANSTAAPLAPLPRVWLNEVQPNNVTGSQDRMGDRDPWVELFNSGTNTADLTGFYLSDNYTNLTKWPFPASTTLASKQFSVVWLDNEPGETGAGELHANFRASSTNGSVVLTKVSGSITTIVDYLNWPALNNDRSYGAWPDGTPAKRQKFYYATPAAPNTNTYPAFPITINEWMASNTSTVPDPTDGDFEDWFEVYNGGPVDIDLSGFTLTDNITNTTQWTIPDGTTLPAGGHLLVWADNETGQNGYGGTDLHANFKLSASGDTIALYAPNGTNIDLVTFGPQTNDVSQGRWPDGNSTWYFMTVPTPRAANTIGNTNNVPPLLNPIGNKSGNEGTLITFTASATDANTGQTLTFSLDPGAPTNAAINPISGVFTWTPNETQGPGSYPVTVRVRDDGSPALSDSETLTITVNEVNSPPSLSGVSDRTVNEGSPLSFTVLGSDPDVPAQMLTYSLTGAPPGASINANSGLFTWTPTEAQGPGVYSNVVVNVTDSGSPPMTTSETLTITVDEVNVAPTLTKPADVAIDELVAWTLQLSATDTDLPAQTLTFSLVSGPAGLTVSSAGLVSWTPTEAQGPSTNTVTVKVADNGTPSQTATQAFTVSVREVNVAPTLAAIADQSVTAGSFLTVTANASDTDQPTNTLTFSLSGNVPAGAAINPSSGIFTWTPSTNQAPSTNAITVQVADNGLPVMGTSRTFTVIVSAATSLRITGITALPAGGVTLTWASQAGMTYRVEYRTDAATASWAALGNYSATGNSTSATDSYGGASQRFYRVVQTN